MRRRLVTRVFTERPRAPNRALVRFLVVRIVLLLCAVGLIACVSGAQGAVKPQLPPIAFSSGAYRFDGDLVVVSADGSQRRVTTANARSDWSPSWSPDGFHIAFSYTYDIGSELRIAVLDVRTGELQELGAGWNPDWSPDGSRLVFVDTEAHDLATVNADGSGRRRLNLVTGTGERTDPAWSPDGLRIAFVASNSALYTVDPSGTNVRTVSSGGGSGRVTWSPDGTRLAYECGFIQICLIGADGSGQSVIRQRGGSPAWSPGGDLIAITQATGPPEVTILIRPNGAEVRTLPGGGDHPDWSPDGRSLVTSVDAGGGIYATESNGTGLTRLAVRSGDSALAWSPDGRSIASRRWNRNHCQIAVRDLESGRVRLLVRRTHDRYFCFNRPEWSPDGTHVVYEGGGELWSVSARGGSPRRISARRVRGFWPRFAPDRRSIGFVARGKIWLLHANGRISLLVRKGGKLAYGPFAWSHDGKKLAYLARRAHAPCCLAVNWDLYVRQGRGAPRKLFEGADVGVTWSPDDQLIAVTRSDPPGSGGQSALFVVNLAGVARMIFSDAAQPDWRP